MSGLQAISKAKAKAKSKSNNSHSSDSGDVLSSKHKASTQLGSFYSAGPILSLSSLVQTKVTVGHPNDQYEHEANTVAETITSGREVPSISRISSYGQGSFAQRQEEPVQTLLVQRQVEEEEEPVQTLSVQRQEEEEPVQTLLVQRQVEEEEEPVQTLSVQRQEEEEPVQTLLVQKQADQEEEPVQTLPIQRQADQEEEPVQTLPIQRQGDQEEEPVQTLPIQRQADQEEEPVQTLLVQRQAEEEEPVQTKSDAGRLSTPSTLSRQLSATQSGGAPLPETTRTHMETQFGSDFSQVRVHTDNSAIQMSQSLNAQAFTRGSNIYFGSGRYNPGSGSGQRLLAHELTHVVQQGGGRRNSSTVAQTSAPVIQRSEDVSVVQQSPVMIQRLGIGDAFDYFAERANLIPGFRMFTIILGLNPINMNRVDRSAANILRALIEFIPGGGLITRALDNYGIFDRVGDWVEQQIRTLGMTGNAIRQAVTEFLDSLSWADILNLGGVWRRARRIFTEPINGIISFARGLATGIIQFIKEAILRPLARLAEGTRGYDLLKAVLGQDPITGDPYPRTADTLIGGFMKLIGQEEVWNDIKRANAVGRAWAWFQGALSGLLAFVRQIPSRFMQALAELELAVIVDLPRVFLRIGRIFGGFIGQFISWAGRQVMSLLQIIFEVVAPGVMPYIRRAAGAFRTIIRNPIGFVRNLVRAGIQGFRQFAGNFLTHLRASLIGWLTGTMSGANIYIPQAFNLREILKFVLSVLGLTWQNIRQKLVRVIGERAVSALETGFELVRTLVTEGPAAAWRKILEGISNLREMVMEQIMNFVRDRVVQAAITRLITSLNPAGAFIQAIIATYNTIMFFVERFRQIAQVAMAFIDSIAAIAGGNISAAANRVEQTMAGMLTLVISFLARIAGLGRVSDAVTRLIDRVRAPIDRALDRVVQWIVRQARRLGRSVARAGVPQDPNERLRLAAQVAVSAARRLSGRVTRAVLGPILAGIRVRYSLQSIEPYEKGGSWWVRATINPRVDQDSDVPSIEGETAKVANVKKKVSQLKRKLIGIIKSIKDKSDQEIVNVVKQKKNVSDSDIDSLKRLIQVAIHAEIGRKGKLDEFENWMRDKRIAPSFSQIKRARVMIQNAKTAGGGTEHTKIKGKARKGTHEKGQRKKIEQEASKVKKNIDLAKEILGIE
jgi:dolichol kinase